MYQIPLLALLLLIACSGLAQRYQNGDIIFQSTPSEHSKAIELATKSSFSHVGIIVNTEGEWCVIEAVQPVKITPLQVFIDRGINHQFTVKRLKNDSIAHTLQANQLLAEAQKHLSKDYDLVFAWDDKEMYCSELVWKIYKNAFNLELCATRKLASFNLTHPVVLRQLAIKYGEHIPYNETVVSPEDIYQSPLLVQIK